MSSKGIHQSYFNVIFRIKKQLSREFINLRTMMMCLIVLDIIFSLQQIIIKNLFNLISKVLWCIHDVYIYTYVHNLEIII